MKDILKPYFFLHFNLFKFKMGWVKPSNFYVGKGLVNQSWAEGILFQINNYYFKLVIVAENLE